MITHAKVRYEDDRKLAIVDVGDIENFKPEHAKDFKSKFFYSVKWTDPDGTSDYYRARILALGESEDDLEGEGGSRQRPRFEKMAYSPDGGSEDEDDVQPERPVKKPSGPKQELLDMLKRKKDDICRKEETATKKQKKRETYDDRGSLVSELKNKLQRLEQLMDRKSKKIEQLQNKNNTLEKEAMELRRLNVRLQEKILTALDEGKGNSRAACSIKSKPEHSRMELIDIDMDVIPRETTPPPDDCPRKENATVDIGSGLRINSCAWSHIQGHQKDSLFVKDLLLGIWPKEQLKNRSLQGKRCPRFPDRPAKTPLTPWKVEVMRDCYRRRLQRQGIPENLVPAALKQLNHFVVEKLADLERMAKRLIKLTHFDPLAYGREAFPPGDSATPGRRRGCACPCGGEPAAAADRWRFPSWTLDVWTC
ncbi:hypothetical protein HPB51_018231 [Rhipicephalus microplus]|uniref:BEN domain-containing protein n=1 Tax=Rhipicephalus microplus TaxID=6941 RepID=A0A9J6E3Q3_RHIMP|nr:hypothetical protein HPB51_018231 [Rhipicephalus microplus]